MQTKVPISNFIYAFPEVRSFTTAVRETIQLLLIEKLWIRRAVSIHIFGFLADGISFIHAPAAERVGKNEKRTKKMHGKTSVSLWRFH